MRKEISFEGLVSEDRVHRSVYTDPEIFQEEIERIFKRVWLFAGHESEVPNPGDYKTDTLAGQWPILLTRDKEGKVHVFFNACRHRGALVCKQPYGKGPLRCAYHGWTYEADGRLIGVPVREAFDLNPDEFGLMAPPRVASYRGFIFVCLSSEGPELDEYLGATKEYFDLMIERAPDGALEVQKPNKYYCHANWKLQIENLMDNYHPPFAHRSAFEAGIKYMRKKYGEEAFSPRHSRSEREVEIQLPRGHGVCNFNGMRDPLWWEAYHHPQYIEILTEKYGEERAQRLAEADYHVLVYPNLFLHTRLSQYRVIKPLAVDRTEINVYACKLKGAPDEMNEAIVRFTSLHVSVMGEVQPDDLEMFERVQEGLKSEFVEWLYFMMKPAYERVGENGKVVAHAASEILLRGQHKAWLQLMCDGSLG